LLQGSEGTGKEKEVEVWRFCDRKTRKTTRENRRKSKRWEGENIKDLVARIGVVGSGKGKLSGIDEKKAELLAGWGESRDTG